MRPPSTASHHVVDHRMAAAMVEAPGYGPMLFISAYLRGGEGLTEANLGLIANTCSFAQREGLPWVMGADFQVCPEAVVHSDLQAQASAEVVAPAGKGTCRSAVGSWNTIDYFLVQRSLASGVQQVAADKGRAPNPHLPVTLKFHPRLCKAEALVFDRPEKLPAQPVFGPRPKPPD